jgi:hypothetical protein
MYAVFWGLFFCCCLEIVVWGILGIDNSRDLLFIVLGNIMLSYYSRITLFIVLIKVLMSVVFLRRFKFEGAYNNPHLDLTL